MSIGGGNVRRIGLGILLAVGIALAPAALAGDAYVREAAVSLAANTSNDAEVTSARIWLSGDGGASWRALVDARFEAGFVRFELPGPGRWGIYIVLENALGQSAPKAQPGMKPHGYVVFDPNPPTVQIRDVRRDETNVAGVSMPTFDLWLTVVDEHLADDAIRVRFRENAAQPWRDGGPLLLSGDRGRWTLPDLNLEQIDIRVVATDRAGNRSLDERTGIPLRSTPATADKGSGATGRAEASGSRDATASASPAESAARMDVPLDVLEDLRNLRERAARHAELGQLQLAVARLREAYALAPNDWDTRLAYADALARTRQFALADPLLRSAIEERPDDARAVEALATVSVGTGDYFEARSHLQRLAELAPDDPTAWLRLGDIELKLGNARPAATAWSRVIESKLADESLRQKARRRLEYFARPVTGDSVASSQ